MLLRVFSWADVRLVLLNSCSFDLRPFYFFLNAFQWLFVRPSSTSQLLLSGSAVPCMAPLSAEWFLSGLSV